MNTLNSLSKQSGAKQRCFVSPLLDNFHAGFANLATWRQARLDSLCPISLPDDLRGMALITKPIGGSHRLRVAHHRKLPHYPAGKAVLRPMPSGESKAKDWLAGGVVESELTGKIEPPPAGFGG